MPTNVPPSETSSLASASPDLTAPDGIVVLPEQIDVVKFRQTDEGRALVKWALDEFTRCKQAKAQKQRQWYVNLSMVYGHQWIDTLGHALPESVAGKLVPQLMPKYYQKDRRTINRLRAFVRSEQSKFLSTLPTVEAVPATAEDEDGRSAKAAEQVWESYAARRRLRREYSKSLYWMILAGSGFLKSWWDPTTFDRYSGQPGDIMFRNVTPFHIFVPDLREMEVDDQPYMMHVQVKNLQWAKSFWAKELTTPTCAPTVAANTLLDDAYLNMQQSPRTDLDSVVVYEIWVKSEHDQEVAEGRLHGHRRGHLGRDQHGGPAVQARRVLLHEVRSPVGRHVLRDSPLVDLIPLQKEFNDLRTEISVGGKRTAAPILRGAEGLHRPGEVDERTRSDPAYNQGFQPPSRCAPVLPDWYVRQSSDPDGLRGHQRPARGVTVATPPRSHGWHRHLVPAREGRPVLTPQYQNVEDGFERIAVQTLALFQEFVDIPRQIKTIGLDSPTTWRCCLEPTSRGHRYPSGTGILHRSVDGREARDHHGNVHRRGCPGPEYGAAPDGGRRRAEGARRDERGGEESPAREHQDEAAPGCRHGGQRARVLGKSCRDDPADGWPGLRPRRPDVPKPLEILAELGQATPEMAGRSSRWSRLSYRSTTSTSTPCTSTRTTASG